ncbi:MAG: hypothetical protein KJ583_02570 [Nanoarchaeota archaeon]|nr:hypothetical protein [Nanoarchaeota archaeon]MBU1269937.1 hypothetical protein [Nanoarchaeota archaeon]MBU1604178.1 hypothetical protein [Nanoarchaeota archaeon]MBU2443079.1 hypothetical protein [Nanoarchaeota archaeon]
MDEAGEGEGKWLLEMIPKLIFLGIAITVIIVFTALFIMNNLRTDDLEIDVFLNKLIYSKNTISYYDSMTGRTYLGIIDPNKLTEKNLNESMEYNGTMYAAKITLGSQEAYYLKSRYLNLEGLAKAKIKGPGGADYRFKKFEVGVMDNNVLRTETIKIEMIKART